MGRKKEDRFTVKVNNSYCDYLLKDMSGIAGFDIKDIQGTLNCTLSLAIDRLGEYEDADVKVKKR